MATQGAKSAKAVDWHAILIAGVVLLAIGVLWLAFGRLDTKDLTATAEGRVTEVEKKVSHSRKRRNRTSYRAKVSFVAEDGLPYEAWEVVTTGTKRHNEGEAVQVRYDPDDPQKGCLIAGDERYVSGNRFMMVECIALGALMCALAIVGLRGRDPLASRGAKVAWAIAGVCALAVPVVVFLAPVDDPQEESATSFGSSNSGTNDDPASESALYLSTLPSVPRMELEVTSVDEVQEGSFDGVGEGRVKGYLVVRNATDDVIDMQATFVHQDGDGQELGKDTDEFVSVAPGATALLRDNLRGPDPSRVTYELRCTKADAANLPLAEGVETKETGVTSAEVEVTVKNTTQGTVRLEDVRVEASGEGRIRRAGVARASMLLGPGKSTTVKFEASNLFDEADPGPWEELERTYCLNGYGSAPVASELPEVAPGDAERVPSEALTLGEVGQTLTGNLEGGGPKGNKGYLVVRNATDKPVSLSAKFTYLDAEGNKATGVTGYDDSTDVVGPDQSVMLCAKAFGDGVASVAYEVTSAESESWATPPQNLEVEELSVTETSLRVRVTNKNQRRAFVIGYRCLAADTEGRTHAAEAYGTSDLQPGESTEVTFSASDVFDPDAFATWEGLERTYYFNGH